MDKQPPNILTTKMLFQVLVDFSTSSHEVLVSKTWSEVQSVWKLEEFLESTVFNPLALEVHVYLMSSTTTSSTISITSKATYY